VEGSFVICVVVFVLLGYVRLGNRAHRLYCRRMSIEELINKFDFQHRHDC
jgi:hypothetical protein